jgi:virginiamycin A acetyltransferase
MRGKLMALNHNITPDTQYPIMMPNGETWPHTVFLKNFIDHPNIEIGEWTYYNDFRKPIDDYARLLAPYLYPGCPERLIIGKFCQIAHGTEFITSSANHQMNGFTTYPFFVFGNKWSQAYKLHLPYKDTIVGHDVWFGHRSMVMPGVTIGSGAIIAANAVVTKDVPPYVIVAGNPARFIKRRFEAHIIDYLLESAWWDWPMDVIEENLGALTSGCLDTLKKIEFVGAK